MITVQENTHSLSVEGPQHSLEIESVDIYSERFYLSQFQILNVDKEV